MEAFLPQHCLQLTQLVEAKKTCPNGHNLVAYRTPIAGAMDCDGTCGWRALPQHTLLYGCRQCDYDLCGNCVSEDHSHLPLAQLLNIEERGRLVQLLACTAQQKTTAKRVIDNIVRIALHPEFRPAEVYESGSFKKGTALQYNFDVDLVVRLRDFDHTRMNDYFSRSRVALIDAFGSIISFKRQSTHRCLKFEVTTIYFDLLFTGDPETNTAGNPVDWYSPAGSHEVDDQLIKAKGLHPVYQALVLLAKHWKNQFESPKNLKSYYVELLCLKSVSTGHNCLSHKEAFREFLSNCLNSDWLVVDNLNRFAKPRKLQLPGQDSNELQQRALETLSSCYGRAGHRLGISAFSDVAREEVHAIMDLPRRSEISKTNEGASEAKGNRNPDWQGEHRFVARSQYIGGTRSGEPCVLKWFKSGRVFESTFWEKDLKAVEKAAEIIDVFNLRGSAPATIYLNRPAVWIYPENQEKVLVEPMLENFHKFNSNTGYVSEGYDLMQALSHFSYHFTSGKYLLCDLQGSFSNSYTLTDPVVLSTTREYGLMDLGQPGIENFFHHHRCNRFCNSHWRKSLARSHFAPQEGSLMLLSSSPLPRPQFQPISRMQAFDEKSDEESDGWW